VRAYSWRGRAPSSGRTSLLISVGWLLFNGLLLLHPGVRYLASFNHDWYAWLKVRPLIEAGDLYLPEHWFVWSPIAMWALAYVFVPLGYTWWMALHVASVAVVRDVMLAALAILSVPFWVDTLSGNTMVFVFAAGAAAILGSRAGAYASLVLFVLMPRPVAAPLVARLLWQQPRLRVPFVALAVLTVLIALASGDLGGWIGNMTAIGRDNSDHFANVGPTKLVGMVWLLIGVPLATFLTLRGWVGVAGIAISPYVLPGYLLVLLWDLEGVRRRNPQTPAVSEAPES